jgi:hypothetical protein
VPAHQIQIANLSAAIVALVIVGLFVQHRARLCWSFLAYCFAVLLGNRLVVLWPETFFRGWFWSLKATVYGVLCAAVAIEIALLTFSQFPRARKRMLAVVACMTAFGGLGLLLKAIAEDGYWTRLGVLVPSAEIGVLFLFAAVLGFAFYYRVPLHPFHRGLMVGFALYLGVDPAVLALVRQFGPGAYPYVAALDPALFASTVGIWAWAAWKRPQPVTKHQQILQPWAATS